MRETEGGREGGVGEILEGWSLAREQKRKGWLLGPHWCMKIIGVSRAHNFWLERREKKKKGPSGCTCVYLKEIIMEK